MQFTKLRLVGFKSFVETQEFIIERGLTGVVGPNGCGKSNLVEALRWVMGENSYKNMRASGMDDVIFSGSATRPLRNSAEVTLFLDNHDYSAPAAFNDADELQVSRRIERQAGSQYKINGKDVRAKDVQLLFADQSTGARSPSMVGQGRIGELIQAKPQARRAILEEAAGISGLHSRRHEAELRLRAAEGNLERLEDVVGDLSSRIESLKRQARQANRYKTLSSDIRQVEAGLYYVRWYESKSNEIEATTALNDAMTDVAEKAQMHMRAQKAQENGQKELPSLREEAVKAQAAHQRLNLALKQCEDEDVRNRQRQSELLRRLEQLNNDIAREQQMLTENSKILENLQNEADDYQNEAENQREIEYALQEKLQELTVDLREDEQKLEELTKNRAYAEAKALRMQQQIDELHQRLQRIDNTILDINQQIQALEAEIAKFVDFQETKSLLEEAEIILNSQQQQLQDLDAAYETARQLENDAQINFNQCRDILNNYQTEARTILQLLESLSHGDFIPIIDEIKVEQGFEIALGAVLGEDLSASQNKDAPVFWQEPSFVYQDAALPKGVKSLSLFVKAPKALQRRLNQIGLVEAENVNDLVPQLQAGQILVTKKGALWRWDGLKARADAPSANAQKLAQKNRLIALHGLIEKNKQDFDLAENAVQLKQLEVEKTRQDLQDMRSNIGQAQEKRDKLLRQFNESERENAALNLRLKALQENKTHYAQESEEIKQHYESAMALAEDAPDFTFLDNEIAKYGQILATKRAIVAEAAAKLQGFKQNAYIRQRRQEAIAVEQKTWQQRIENAKQQIKALEIRREEALLENEDLAAMPEHIEETRQNLLDEIAKIEANGHEILDKLAKAENAKALLDQESAKAFAALSASREQRIRAEERLHALETRRKDIEARILETLNCQAHETIKLAAFEIGDALPEISNLEQKLERLRLERERLGAVNLRAEEEEQELRNRYDAMTSERDDVVEAIKKLRQAIQSLNREGRERLLAAFEKVNTEFLRLFSHLFGGGEAQLQLIESDDPLDAGLEILARPPGKKPQTMTLLSGGEQALTAMALIFAVFLTNPAPICVLDEVDAPLDDHNVERYCNLMDEMATLTTTRFVIITHNPITMARMDRLFGVTMGEQGVSQLVSVDLQTAEQLREIE